MTVITTLTMRTTLATPPTTANKFRPETQVKASQWESKISDKVYQMELLESLYGHPFQFFFFWCSKQVTDLDSFFSCRSSRFFGFSFDVFLNRSRASTHFFFSRNQLKVHKEKAHWVLLRDSAMVSQGWSQSPCQVRLTWWQRLRKASPTLLPTMKTLWLRSAHDLRVTLITLLELWYILTCYFCFMNRRLVRNLFYFSFFVLDTAS